MTGDVFGRGVKFNEMSGRASGDMRNEMLTMAPKRSVTNETIMPKS